MVMKNFVCVILNDTFIIRFTLKNNKKLTRQS